MGWSAATAKGRVVIPAEIRKLLGIEPGTRLDLIVEGRSLRVDVVRHAAPARFEDCYELLVCKSPRKLRLTDFDVTRAMEQRSK